MVTFAPSRCQTLPSSSPITPAPTMPRRAGTASKSRAPAESTIREPSNGADGSAMGAEPLARTTFVAVTVSMTAPEDTSLISMALPGMSRPCPWMDVTLFALNRVPMPRVSPATMLFLRPIIAATSISAPLTVMPWAGNWCLIL